MWRNMRQVCTMLTIVAALGYFVDIYDLVLFSIVRLQSLKDLGFSGQELLDNGVFLLNMQMGGMLLGGILWGVWGDKKGRLAVLFGSILMYSLANIANAFVHDIHTYAACRFVAGIGLAGELGAGITLVSETISKELRGYATMIVASVGVSGAVMAGLIAEHFSWQANFMIGGVLGLLLLVLRISVHESGLFLHVKQQKVARGSFGKLFTNRKRFFTYLQCILIGVPLWYVVGILVTFSPEIAKALNIQGDIKPGSAVMLTYVGLILGDFLSGLFSQLWATRKKVILYFLICLSLNVVAVLLLKNVSASLYYMLFIGLGVFAGYWALFVTVAAEQFGTNVRSTVTTTVPNFVRGAVIPTTLAFQWLTPQWGIVGAAALVGLVLLSLSFVALFFIPETYGKDLDYVEVM